MTARLTRLRIAGFKSFAEPVSLDILPGLTGIVGPNGCGKSNVAEALRWAMGETSARSLRGDEMDDVIFAGTAVRPSRNLAEVTITLEAGALEQGGDPLPAPFEAEAELQVTRRIERGAGSSFRARGREVRARDVQTMFADLSSGARSSGMVSQGRVADLVRARPEDRRQVLEEAAGITGLHARRHEAEMKLRAAEQNVARAEDLHGQLAGTRDGLRKQARQAARYRNLSGLIRTAEAEHLAVQLGQAAGAARAARAGYTEAQAEWQAACKQEAAAATAMAEAEAALPLPHAAEAAARTLLERRRMQAETLAGQAGRLAREAADAAARLTELAADEQAACHARDDAAATVDHIAAEHADLALRLTALPAALADASASADEANQHAGSVESETVAATNRAAAARDAAEQAAAAAAAAADRLVVVRAQQAVVQRALATCAAERVSDALLAEAAVEVSSAQRALTASRDGLEQAEHAAAATGEVRLAARLAADRADTARQTAMQAAEAAASRAGELAEMCRSAEAAQAAGATARPDPDTVRQAQEADRQAEATSAAAEAGVQAAERHHLLAATHAARARRDAETAGGAWERARADVEAAGSRRRQLDSRLAEADAACLAAAAAGPEADALAEAKAAQSQAVQEATAAESLRAQSDREAAAAAALAATARQDAARAEAGHARLAAEAEGLAAALGDAAEDGLLGSLTVPPGLEAAVGAVIGKVLGEAAQASLEQETPGETAPQFWRTLAPLRVEEPRLAGSAALDLADAPAALHRALSQIVLLDDGVDGDAVQAALQPGMSAVNRNGACWRWDGFVARAGAPNGATLRLCQRRRLAEIRDGLASAALGLQAAGQIAQALEAEAQDAARSAVGARDTTVRAVSELHAATRTAERLAVEAAGCAAHHTVLQAVAERSRAECRATVYAHTQAEAVLCDLPDPSAYRATADAADAAAKAGADALQAAREARDAARNHAAQAVIAARTLSLAAERTGAVLDTAIAATRRARAELQAAADTAGAARRACDTLPATVAAAEVRAAESADITARAAAARSRQARMEAEAALDAARQAEAGMRADHARADMQHAGMVDRLQRCEAELEIADRQAARAGAAFAGLCDPAVLDMDVLRGRSTLLAARETALAAQSELAALRAEQAQAGRRQNELTADLQGWTRRLSDISGRAATYGPRLAAARAALTALADTPAEIGERAARSVVALEQAEVGHHQALAACDAADRHARATAETLRNAARQAAGCAGQQARTEAVCDAAEAALAATRTRIADRLNSADLPEAETTSSGDEDRARHKFERLARERDEMGPVNLRAELELETLDARLAGLDAERAELTTAIAKLRGAIGHLNREGRERLTAIFTEVDAHFRTLFTRMMGGGRAHLALVGSDDPLLAGLEIYAEPPGKKLSALSLLSGGEQALTALSLIFAVFRCMPAPLCVLDEVDAPLDDANVERFCTLLDDMVRDTATSFLVVTHHQLTMSRMDRLYGVTMQERGVSRLLSVDLSRTASMTETLRHAAE